MLVKANLDEERWRIAQAWGRVERWHILHARGNDRDVARALAKLNYLCYRPIIREIVLTPRRGERVEWRPLFPGYVFVDLQGKSWPPLDSMTCEPLKMDQEPATIGTAEYRAIREIELYYQKHPRQARELVSQKERFTALLSTPALKLLSARWGLNRPRKAAA